VISLLFIALAAAPKEPPRLVEVAPKVEGVVIDLRYATEDNFFKQQLYPADARCMLLDVAVDRLAKAAAALKEKGYRLKVWDCYRPYSVQLKMWEVFPHHGYVADPKIGSNHNRASAVDLTLITLDEKPVEMPTGFDSFQRAAHQGYDKVSDAAKEHRETLREAMEAAGFITTPMEWWHYDLPEAPRFPVRDEPLGQLH
jgi:D-alanyl-D-alanine dipeptidase